MNMHNTKKMVMQVSSLALVLLLSGCDWFDNKKEASPAGQGQAETSTAVMGKMGNGNIIATMGGKNILTMQEFEERFEQLLNGQPQLKTMLQFMPDLKVDVAKNLVSQSIMDKYVQESGIYKSGEYVKDLELARDQAQKLVNIKHFRKACETSVTPEEVKKYYDERKDDHQELILTRGGIATSGVSFEKESDAKAFLAKVTGKTADELKKAAEADKLGAKFRNFGMVGSQSMGIDNELRDKVTAMTKPGTELIKINDKLFWVVNVGKKEETKYRTFEEVKEGLSKFLANHKVEECMEAKLEELKTKYDVKINEDLLKPKKEDAPKTAENDITDESENLNAMAA